MENKLGLKNSLINDDPIYKIENDKLEYNSVVDRLSETLLKEKHKKAISIGLIGPWGNGKSSVIHMVEEKIKNDPSFKQNDIISIHFLPYLNHNDDDIINEFFITLSNELSTYNGKLSNELINYSQKLTDLYKEKNILNFLETHITNIKSSSANELYESINKMLETIDKKIIVFVDDLDRLNQTEILQVLKLIRNTANFNNTIFVVAMDKEYVISRLKSSEDILNSKFIDKFFQLEIYLPEIKTQILKEYFILALTDRLNPNGPSDFSIKIKESIDNPDNLFEDYITNFRDVKRTINQIVFDYPFTGGEINFKDFVNFTYFKLKFPQFIKILKEGKADFLDIDGKGFYKFKVKPKDASQDKSADILDLIQNIRLTRNVNLEQYILYNEKFVKDCIVNDNIIDCEDRILFIKTLAFLFGEENQVNDVDSIKYENNFRMLMEQKIYKDLFKNSEFKEIIDTQLPELGELIENLHRTKKIQQLLNRIEYFNSQDEKSLKQIITILLILFERKKYYQLYDVYLVSQIEKFVKLLFDSKNSKEVISIWLKEIVFEGKILSDYNKLLLFGKLWDFKYQNDLWNIDEKYIFESVIKLFKKYISDTKSMIPPYNDYTIYGLYHSVKNIGELNKEIKLAFLEFWTPEKNEILCVHLIEMDPFTKSLFKLSDMAVELFGSYSNFIHHIKITSKNPDEGLKELILFLDLSEITDHNGYIVFEFKKSEPMKEKVNAILNNSSRSTYDGLDNMSQFVFELNNESVSNSILMDEEIRKLYNLKKSEYNNKWYIYSTFNGKIKKEDIMKIAKLIYTLSVNQLELTKIEEKKVVRNENFIPENNNSYTAKLFSAQPPIN